jgi:transcriptional regulator with XRE-family HTH domain
VRKRNPELARAMAAQGLTISDLARRVGCDVKTASNALNMLRTPHRLTARAFAAALGCDVRLLFPDLPPDPSLCPACQRAPASTGDPQVAPPTPTPAPTPPAPASVAKPATPA